VTGTPAKAVKWKAQYGIPDKSIYNYETMSRMADNPDIDVVYVVTPNALHARDTIKAAKAGKHVPLREADGGLHGECQQMVDAGKKANRQLAIGYRCRFEPHHLEMLRVAGIRRSARCGSSSRRSASRSAIPTQWRLNYAPCRRRPADGRRHLLHPVGGDDRGAVSDRRQRR
jgi:predicted dehydrogenase